MTDVLTVLLLYSVGMFITTVLFGFLVGGYVREEEWPIVIISVVCWPAIMALAIFVVFFQIGRLFNKE